MILHFPCGRRCLWPAVVSVKNKCCLFYFCRERYGDPSRQSPGGGTNLSAGLDRAVQILTGTNGRVLSDKIIILLTDGQWNAGRDPVLLRMHPLQGSPQMNLAGTGTEATVTVTSHTTSVTAPVSVPAGSVSRGRMRFTALAAS